MHGEGQVCMCGRREHAWGSGREQGLLLPGGSPLPRAPSVCAAPDTWQKKTVPRCQFSGSPSGFRFFTP